MAAELLSKFNRIQARKLLPKRKKTDSKIAGGKSLIIAGSEGMFGAAVLAGSAAARVGSGYVILLTDQKKFSSAQHPDFLVADWKQKKISDIKFTAVGIGPGIGRSAQASELLQQLLKLKIQNVVIDADALNLHALNKNRLLPKTWIATPHEGELSRLLNIPAEVIKKNRISAVKQAQKKLGCVVLLKGSKTLIATDEKIFEIQSGNRALAKSGTGDVLTGIITGFLAQGLSPQEAACLGAYVHGSIADKWIKDKKDYLSLMASDLLTAIPQALKNLRENKLK